jgi:hypothetical protein
LDKDINDTQCSSDYGAAGTAASYVSCYEKYSERAVVTVSSGAITLTDGDQLRFVYEGTNVSDLEDLISNANGTAAYTYIQYDFRSINGGSNDVNYYLNFTIGDDTINSLVNSTQTSNASGASKDKYYSGTGGTTSNTKFGHATNSTFSTGLIGQALLNSPAAKNIGFGSLDSSKPLRVTVELNAVTGTLGDTLSSGTSYPITMDFVTFGQSNDGVTSGDRHNN